MPKKKLFVKHTKELHFSGKSRIFSRKCQPKHCF